ncbi:carboxyltransferase domain-containing protein [Bacillus aerolatus]|uniref:Carboxyltransferase domain-containing protein n=1 Tax=Bacillus aerolatus TaxID=2653354 RepID=A0A6I1FJL6_9BACI|nr:carboxyltransferase domain-containing protein [Bacillus aerolatus]KAB7706614.1 carboxyltransferase domain-containing protein [Bacillus aerolatus]
MLIFPETRFDFCGDEYIYAEISKDMRIESNFKAISITNELRNRDIPGMIEIYPGNASYLIRYDPNEISPYHLLDYLQEIDQQKSDRSELNFSSRIIEIPVWYNDTITEKTMKKYQHLQPEAGGDDFTFVMKANGFTDKDAFISAHSSTPYFITSLGFKPGTAWGFPLGVRNDKVIQAPKYKSPRAYTPGEAVGVGGAFTVVYPTESTGSYQLIGLSAVPVYDPGQSLSVFHDSFFLAKPGDLWKYRPITEAEFYNIREEVKKRTYEYKIKPVQFSVEQYDEKGTTYISQLMEGF